MAKGYTFAEAAEIIIEGEDMAAIADIGKRYPVTAMAIAACIPNEGFKRLIGLMPEVTTMLKMEQLARENMEDTGEDEEEDEGSGEEAKEKPDYEAMSAKALIAICEKKKIKVPTSTKPKSYYIDLLNAAEEKEEPSEDEEPEDDWGEEETEPEGKYDGMKAPVLYKECKKRGIATKPEQKAVAYIKLLEADDEKNAKKTAGKTGNAKPAGSSKGGTGGSKPKDDDWDI